VTIDRKWKILADRIELELPMDVQLVKADERVKADRGCVALRRGPLVYNVESANSRT